MRIKKQYIFSLVLLFLGVQTLIPKEPEGQINMSKKREECRHWYKKSAMKIAMGLFTAIFAYYRLSQGQQPKKMGSLLVLF